jgi:malonate-semialdehyde dehydrogenase (acetylating)/methylmalonate-semialdehyde dehydrogenase
VAEPDDVDVPAGRRRLEAASRRNGPANLIGGRWRSPTGAETEPRFDPSEGATIGALRYSSDGDLDDAVRSASAAQRSWARIPASERVRPLEALARNIRAARPWLAPVISIEVGKTLAEANEEVDLSCRLIEATLDATSSDRSAREPLGVVAGISLYHYPLLTPLWLMLPALNAGNGYLLRPCTWSPVTGVIAAQLVDGAGYPEGLVNVVHGSLTVVDGILRHPGVPAVSYVGSGPWARYMVDSGQTHGKRVEAQGAIRQIHVVNEDADPVASARLVCRSAVSLAGQRWLAGCTVIVIGSIASQFVDSLCQEATDVRVGVSTDPLSTMGPVIQRARQRELVRRIHDATAHLDVPVVGTHQAHRAGFFVGPTVIDRVPAGHPLLVEQVPGPLVSVVRVPSADAIDPESSARWDEVRTIHSGDDHRDASTTTWFGSLPWGADRTERFSARS